MPNFSTMPESFVSNASLAVAVSREVKFGRLRKIWSRFTPAIPKNSQKACAAESLAAGRCLSRRSYGLENRPAANGSVFLIADHKLYLE